MKDIIEIYPHLTFDGQCEEAFQFYEKLLGGKITYVLRYGEAPYMKPPAGYETKVMHATLKLGEQTLSGIDSPPGHYERPRGFTVQLNLNDPARGIQYFEALAEGGTILYPIQRTFWADRYGVVTDRFGTPWEINATFRLA